jgi:hypothetical protein
LAGRTIDLGGDYVFQRLSSDATNLQEALEAETEFSLARYEPMARLLSHEDLDFLKSQPGYTAEMGRKFSRERRRIFRMYLSELKRDFSRLHADARAVVANLGEEYSSLVGVLIRQQVRFWYEMTAVEMRLSLSWTGIAAVDARGLVEALGLMHLEINRLAAPSAA